MLARTRSSLPCAARASSQRPARRGLPASHWEVPTPAGQGREPLVVLLRLFGELEVRMSVTRGADFQLPGVLGAQRGGHVGEEQTRFGDDGKKRQPGGVRIVRALEIVL